VHCTSMILQALDAQRAPLEAETQLAPARTTAAGRSWRSAGPCAAPVRCAEESARMACIVLSGRNTLNHEDEHAERGEEERADRGAARAGAG
jgi:hypothetical protein